MRNESSVGDVPVRVVELTGAPGDVVIAHPWMLHAGSLNCGGRPRFMRVQRIRKPAADPDTRRVTSKQAKP